MCFSRTLAHACLALACAVAPNAEAQTMSPYLTASEVVPPHAPSGGGLALVVIDPAANTLFFEVIFVGGFFELSAHIHGFAGPGANGPILFDLPLGLTKTGTWIYPESLEAQLLSGEAYLDIHSPAFPGGELRGQLIVEDTDATLYARMTGLELTPPQLFKGQEALLIMNLDLDANVAMIRYSVIPVVSVSFSNLHGYAPPGADAPVLTSLFDGFTVPWNYAPSDEGKILSGLLYGLGSDANGPTPLDRGQVHLVHTKAPPAISYCTAGTSSTGCQASMYATGYPSATALADFQLRAAGVPGLRSGIFFFGTSGRQANPWGNGSSFQCVTPPVSRAGLMAGEGTAGLCDSFFVRDLNARWCPTCPQPAQNPGAGAVVQAQLWYRDPLNTSNQTTSLSDAIEFTVQP